jgi:hypothetical protein
MELVDIMEGGVRAEAGRTLLALAEACEKQRTAKSVLRDGVEKPPGPCTKLPFRVQRS